MSAGSIIAGQDIEIAGWGMDGDENDIALSDLTGMSLTDKVIFPHYTDANESEVLDFEKTRGVKVVRMEDGDGMFIES